jgi:hypothetical protein
LRMGVLCLVTCAWRSQSQGKKRDPMVEIREGLQTEAVGKRERERERERV